MLIIERILNVKKTFLKFIINMKKYIKIKIQMTTSQEFMINIELYLYKICEVVYERMIDVITPAHKVR